MHIYFPKIFIFLDHYNSEVFKNKNKNIGIVYRNYKDRNREKELIKIAKECKKKRYLLFVSNDIKLFYKVKADGIYIPSFNKSQRFSNLENRRILILGSAHNQKEIHNKITQNCKLIFLSPLFYVEKSKTYLNLYKFNNIAFRNKKNILALGGITENNLHKLKLLHIGGFGGIRMFKKKPAILKAGFYKE